MNTNERQDLAVRDGNRPNDPVAVLLEFKKPSNTREMITESSPNVRALHELLLYYLREVHDQKNPWIRHLVATNVHEWYIFDGAWFEKNVARNTSLRKQYEDWKTSGFDTRHFYDKVAAPFFDRLEEPLPCTHLPLSEYESLIRDEDYPDEQKLVVLYKLFSPEHLLKKPFANDSNSLNKEFYHELLHIMGLHEVKENGTKRIKRLPEAQRRPGSLLENTLNKLRTSQKMQSLADEAHWGESEDERLFSVALELVITWLNRVLFLKLLEGQLLKYHKGNRDFAFLNTERIADFDELNELFFEVLAVPQDLRQPNVAQKFGNIPYLNSSLFELTDLEVRTVDISCIKDRLGLPLYPHTVLKDGKGKRLTGDLGTLRYLFAFLDAFNFASEGSADIQEDNKSLINAAVLGLIFEKINGYQEGSFFTPGFVTMYMCRESIRRAVVQRFNAAKGWDCPTFEALKERIDFTDRDVRAEANAIVNSIKICDPAVGSGHFLVSALNELIAVKSELRIISNSSGAAIFGFSIVVENDELAVVNENDDYFFDYTVSEKGKINPVFQNLQETLFHEKQTLIEQCLFGVDINPKSVMICRLRLWIELLKNAYYRPGTHHLQTLPNLDINIKCGNSLVSRFALNADLRPALRGSKWTIETYKNAVAAYREARDKNQKRELERLLADIKANFKAGIFRSDPRRSKLEKLGQELYHRFRGINLFMEADPGYGDDADTKADEERKRLESEISKLETEIKAESEGVIFRNAFEWRFEFPEVLDADGDFLGFDLVVGNPPYIRQEELAHIKPYLQRHYKEVYAGTADMYVFFVQLGLRLLRPQTGIFHYILPNKWMRAGYGKLLREWLAAYPIRQIVDFGDLPVFDSATTYPCLFEIALHGTPLDRLQAATVATLDFETNLADHIRPRFFSVERARLNPDAWTLANNESQDMLDKIRAAGQPLGDYVEGKFYYGIKTGDSKTFVIDDATKTRLIAEDPRSAEIIKPFLAGRDVKRFLEPKASRFLILFKNGSTREEFGNLDEKAALQALAEAFPAVVRYLIPFEEKAKLRSDKGQYWWELRPCDYYEIFSAPKIMYQSFQVKPCFIYDSKGIFCNNSMWILPCGDKFLLGFLNSSMSWFLIGQYCTAIQNGYQLIWDSFRKVPIPNATPEQKALIAALVEQILAAKAADPTADTTALEAEIDQLVYALYGLTDAEIQQVAAETRP